MYLVNSHSDSYLGLFMHSVTNTYLKKTKVICHSVKAGGHPHSLFILPWKLLHSGTGGSSQRSKFGPVRTIRVGCLFSLHQVLPSPLAWQSWPWLVLQIHVLLQGLLTFCIVLPFPSLPPPRNAHLDSWPPCPPPPLLLIL